METLLNYIEYLSFGVGIIGIGIILIGVSRGLFHYLLSIRATNFAKIRYEVGSHIILGLDFLVAQDIIDTLLIDKQHPEHFWMDLASLITVVTIRIILTYFIQKEIEEIKESDII